MDDIAKLRKNNENNYAAKWGSVGGKSSNVEKLNEIGKEALKLSNEFRKKHRKRELMWHEDLARIGFGHSKDMGEKKVIFDHVGVKERFAAYPFKASSAAENLAMSKGHHNIGTLSEFIVVFDSS